MTQPDRLTVKQIDPVEPEPFKWIRNSAGEIIGAETYEELTPEEFKRRFPEHASKDTVGKEICGNCGEPGHSICGPHDSPFTLGTGGSNGTGRGGGGGGGGAAVISPSQNLEEKPHFAGADSAVQNDAMVVARVIEDSD